MNLKLYFSIAPFILMIAVSIGAFFDAKAALVSSIGVVAAFVFSAFMNFRLMNETQRIDGLKKELDDLKRRVEGIYLTKTRF
jgi:hypothetical protein